MAVKDARSVRAAQRSQILDGHRSGGYARQRALSTGRSRWNFSLLRRASFYNVWAGKALLPDGRSHAQGGKTGARKRGLPKQTPKRFLAVRQIF